MPYEFGDVVLVPFPFTDQTSAKQRPAVIVSKRSYDASLDTLFLTMPISWRGTLAQYVGRLHREYHAKREVIVYDYVDSGAPLLARMALKRQAGYRSLGYEISTASPATI